MLVRQIDRRDNRRKYIVFMINCLVKLSDNRRPLGRCGGWIWTLILDRPDVAHPACGPNFCRYVRALAGGRLSGVCQMTALMSIPPCDIRACVAPGLRAPGRYRAPPCSG